MKRSPKLTSLLSCLIFVISAALATGPLFSQQERVPATVSNLTTAVLSGNLHPSAVPDSDRGPADPGLRLNYITLIVKRTSAQQRDLEQLIAAQQNPASPDYRRWLSPAQYADRFGLDTVSMGRIRAWLESHGMSIDAVAASRNWIAFSATAAQIENTLHAPVHIYEVGGRSHFALASEPSVPSVLGPVILGFRGLDDFVPQRPSLRRNSNVGPAAAGGNGINNLAPDDLAVIYDIAPLYSAGIDGTGQKIAVVGEANVNLTDLNNYRTKFNLPAMTPQIVAVPDPGIPLATTEEPEASLDLEISGAVARNADFVYVYSTNVEDAVTWTIDNSLAPIVSMSFHSCEKNFSSTAAAALRTLAQEANVKGITWINASGDSGPADCDTQDVSGQIAQKGLSVNLYAAIPEVTAVGGTEFNEGTGVYWYGTNNSNLSSASGYIPEISWNDTLAIGALAASGGGISTVFPVPSWQSGPGFPNSGGRGVPDIAFSASWAHDGYLVCNSGNCNGVYGGTSAGTPLFAGVVALLNQYLLKTGVLNLAGLGNINPTLYRLAQNSPTVFHDITAGSNIVPCVAASRDCTTGSFGYTASTGYDLVTGLGSVDVNSLLTAWQSAISSAYTSTTTTLTSATTAVSTGASVVLTATVQAANGTAPGGTVSFTIGTALLGSASLNRASSSSTATFTVSSTQLAAGANVITARYAGNSEFTPSLAATTVTLSGTTQTSSVQMFISPDPVYQQPALAGNAWSYTVTLREVNGVSTTLTSFQSGANNLTSTIATLFGSTAIPARGSVTATLTSTALTVPTPITFTVNGVDPSGAAWAAPVSVTVPFLGRQPQASMQLSGAPSAVLQNPAGGSSCQWTQQFQLRELSGASGVNLTRFVAGGADESTSIASFWGSTRLTPGGTLRAGMCWSGISAPALLNYEVDGTDDGGNPVTASMTFPYLNTPAAPNTLSISPASVKLTSSATILLGVTTSAPSQVWSVRVFSSGAVPSWLSLLPVSGTGSAQVTLAVSTSGLAAGTYQATLMFESLSALPQLVQVPVTLVITSSQ